MHLPESGCRHPPVASRRALGEEPRRAGVRPGGWAAGHQHRALGRLRSDRHLHPPRAWPALAGHAGLRDQGMRDQAVADPHDLMRSVPVQPGPAVLADREPDPGAPAESARVAGQRLDRHRALEAGDPPELLADDLGLDLALGGQAGVLPVAAAAAAWSGVRAGRADPLRRGLEDLDRVRAGEPGGRLGDDGPHPLPRQRVPDEEHLAGLGPGDAPAAVHGLADAQIEHVSRLHRPARLTHHPPPITPPHRAPAGTVVP